MLPQKDTPLRPPQVTAALNFIETEEVKQKEKTEECASTERARENPWRGVWGWGQSNKTEVSNLPDRECKSFIRRVLTELAQG